MKIYNITDEISKGGVLDLDYECDCIEVDYKAPYPPRHFRLFLNFVKQQSIFDLDVTVVPPAAEKLWYVDVVPLDFYKGRDHIVVWTTTFDKIPADFKFEIFKGYPFQTLA